MTTSSSPGQRPSRGPSPGGGKGGREDDLGTSLKLAEAAVQELRHRLLPACPMALRGGGKGGKGRDVLDAAELALVRLQDVRG